MAYRPASSSAEPGAASPGKSLRQRYEEIIRYGNDHPEDVERALMRLRKLILLEGLPPETEDEARAFVDPDAHADGAACTLRGVVWKILLRIRHVDAEAYMKLVRAGKSNYYDKIRDDTFRTFPKDKEFTRRVPEDKLIRVLNAFVHSCGPDSRFSYVQGMNILCAPFLNVMPEVDAFFCFSRFLTRHCPLYVTRSVEGARTGCKLLDECLKVVDPELFTYLFDKGLTAQIYAFPSVLSFCGCTPPLGELLRVWDFLLAFGIHLNILCTVAQFVLMRDDLLQSPSPMKLLRTLPRLDSELIITVAVQLLRQLPEDLYDRLVRHTYQSVN